MILISGYTTTSTIVVARCPLLEHEPLENDCVLHISESAPRRHPRSIFTCGAVSMTQRTDTTTGSGMITTRYSTIPGVRDSAHLDATTSTSSHSVYLPARRSGRAYYPLHSYTGPGGPSTSSEYVCVTFFHFKLHSPLYYCHGHIRSTRMHHAYLLHTTTATNAHVTRGFARQFRSSGWHLDAEP